jgi:hypothetical protein
MTRKRNVTPWGHYSTFGATQPIKGYKDAYKFGSRPDGYKLTDSPMKVNRTGIAGGHLKASSSLGIYSTSAVNKIYGLCTPCHDPHGVSPTLGSGKPYAVPMLKGTWLTSPYKEDNPPPDPVRRPGANSGPFPTATGGDWGSPGGSNHYSNAPDPKAGELVTRTNLDRNTFGAGNTVVETDQTFAGLCLRCHGQEKLINKGNPTPAWKSVDAIHRSVKGWGNNREHSYTCSKCHLAHNSGLPRLMQTNCLDATHRGNRPNGGIPSRAYSQSGSSGSAAASEEHRGYPEGNLWGTYSYAASSCHANKNSGQSWPNNQKWNGVTPW